MKWTFLLTMVTMVTTFFIPSINFAQAPPLGSTAKFVIFTTTGAVGNTVFSQITGDVGTNNGATTGFGNVNGVMQSGNGATAAAAGSLTTLYNQLASPVPTAAHAPLLGNGETLTAGVYNITGQTTLSNVLNLDAQGNSNAVFIFKISAVLSTTTASQVNLINGALACNIFWKVEGAVNIGSLSSMKGTVVANNGAIDMATGAKLEGRLLSTTGAITVSNVTAKTPIGCGSAVLTGPAAPNLGTTACYGIFSAGGDIVNTGISNIKGDIGTNVGLTTGYNPLLVDGTIHPIPDPSTAAAASDLGNARTYLNGLTADIELLYPAQFGNKLVLTPHTYVLNGGTSLTDTLYLNAENNADGVFLIKIYGALTTATFATVTLINGAQAKNVYWIVNGAISINDFSDFKGTIIANNGAIDLKSGVKLDGRAMTTVGAFSTSSLTANITAGCSGGTLPLTLINFKGNVQNTNGMLSWKTSNEQSTKLFEVEESLDGRAYARVGTVNATGTSAGDQTYTYTSKNISKLAPSVYYRLKMIDADGKFTYSNTIVLQFKSTVSVSFYPNPVVNIATLTLTSRSAERMSYNIIDNYRKLVHTETVNLTEGFNNININVKTLSPGLCFLSIRGNQLNERVKFVKK
jgi:hypothetical protein